MQPFDVPITVYVVDETGFAFTLEPVVIFNPVDGDHEYVVAPLPVNVVEEPVHIAILPDVETIGDALTVIVLAKDFVHPFAAVPVIE